MHEETNPGKSCVKFFKARRFMRQMAATYMRRRTTDLDARNRGLHVVSIRAQFFFWLGLNINLSSKYSLLFIQMFGEGE